MGTIETELSKSERPFRDITERKKAKEQITLFKMIADQSSQGIGVGTPDGNIMYANKALCNLMEARHENDLIGANFTTYYQGIFQEKMTKEVLPTLMKTGSWSGDMKLYTLKGNELSSSETYNLIKDLDGKPLFISVVIEDHTEKRRIQDELHHYRTDLESIVIEKTRKLQDSEQSLREKNQDADLINLLNRTANEGKSLSEVLNIAAKLTKKMFHGLGSAVYLFDENQEYLELQNQAQVNALIRKMEKLAGWKSFEIKIPVDSEHIYMDVIRKGKTRCFNDDAEIRKLYHNFSDTLSVKLGKGGLSTFIINQVVSALKLKSIVTLPLISNNRAIGILDIGSRLNFSSSDVKRIENIAGHLTSIIIGKQAEVELKHALLELERSNKELEQFAYVASHDLQEPLRKVKIYTDLFAAHFSDLQDDKSTKYISYITDGTSRMQTLIADLLAFSRVATHHKPFERTSMKRILDQAVAKLQPQIEESLTIITCDELPALVVDDSQMFQVLLNLMVNAIKFRREDENPRIHIGCVEENAHWKISIKDNGIGIEPEYSHKIFEVFQRLHGQTKYPGNGIGLALCKKIVERHKGEIWFESDQNNGTIFHFTIPKTA